MLTQPRRLFLAVVLVAGALAIADLVVESSVLSDVASVVYGLVAITLFAPDLRRDDLSPGMRALAWVGVIAGAALIAATIGDRLT